MKYKNRVIKPDLDRKTYTFGNTESPAIQEEYAVPGIDMDDILKDIAEYDELQEEIAFFRDKYQDNTEKG